MPQEHLFDVIFQRTANTALAPVLNGQGKGNETFDIILKALPETLADQVAFQGAEQDFLAIHPCQQHSVWTIARVEASQGFTCKQGEFTRRRKLAKLCEHQFEEVGRFLLLLFDSDFVKDKFGSKLQFDLIGFSLCLDRKARVDLVGESEKPAHLVGDGRPTLGDDDEDGAVLPAPDDQQIALGSTH